MEANKLSRDQLIKKLLARHVLSLPQGELASKLSSEAFAEGYPAFVEAVLTTAAADISGIHGYGEFGEENQPPFATCEECLRETFSNEEEGYWYHWREMFGTTLLSEAFFEEFYEKMMKYAPYCENMRYLVNGFTYFGSMVFDQGRVAFVDWSRSGVLDFLLDFAIMDSHRPWLRIPERLWDYAQLHQIDIPHFHERFLCMAYYHGLDALRWHASIDDEESCRSLMSYLAGLEERIMKIGEPS